MTAKPPSTFRPLVPDSLPLAAALQRSAPLALLRQRLADSNARFAAVRGLLPPALLSHVQPGPVDEDGWSLLVGNAAVAAKLRHLVPRLEQSLREQGLPTPAIRIKVQAR